MTTQISSQSAPRNPFRPGMGLEPPYLADREAQLDRFARFLGGFPDFPRNVRLTGLRGVGKTVLLQHFARTAEELGWVVVSREWSEHLGDEQVLAVALVEDCRQATEAVVRGHRLRPALGAARQALDFLGSLSVSLGGVTLTLRPPAERAPRQLAIEDQLLAALRITCESIKA